VVWVYQAEEDQQEGPDVHRYVHNGALVRTGLPRDLLNFAVWDIHTLAHQRTRDFLLLHAGAVVQDGRTVLLPASPESGKSSLVIALLELGFDYLSDELGAIDPLTARIHPFPKRISVAPESLGFFAGLAERLQDRAGLGSGLLKRYVRPEDLDAAVAGPAAVRVLVFPTSDHEGAARLTRLSRAEAVHRMTANSFNVPIFGERALALLSRLAREAPAFQLDGGTPRERAASIRELMAELR
jgi:hypothetical protein